MQKKPSILIIDDNQVILQTLELLLSIHFGAIRTLTHPASVFSELQKTAFDVILLDMNFKSGVNNGNEGLYWLSRIKEVAPQTPVVLFTAYADIDLAVEGMRAGATDFVTKPWNNEKLVESLLRAVQKLPSIAPKKQTASTSSALFWGETPEMVELKSFVSRIAQTDANVLITGENGTGKEMLAREIHRLSKRKNNEMVSVDMGAIPETLFESELFGYAKGAFTDAKADKKGKFESANESSLFMDEIGNMPLIQQVKLLSCIQTREVTPVGGVKSLPVNIRLIAATNSDLAQKVKEGLFREDLFYRINTIHLHIPPLRNRKDDIAAFANLFLSKYAHRYDFENLKLSSDALKKLEAHTWHGNIRELEHAIEKAVILSGGTMLTANSFLFAEQTETVEVGNIPITLEEMEQQMIEKTLHSCEGNLSAVAAQLGISRQTLYNKMKKFNL